MGNGSFTHPHRISDPHFSIRSAETLIMDATRELADLFADAWKVFVDQMPDGTVREDTGVVATLGNVPLPFLNFCFQSEPVDDRAAFAGWLERAKSMAAEEHATIVAVCEPWLPEGWEEDLADAGMSVAIMSTGMATDGLAPPRRPLPDLDIRRIEDAEAGGHLSLLNAAAYDMPPDLFTSVTHLDFSGERAFGHVGYLADGTPVASAAALPVNDTVYVAFVATHPDHQRRGYAEAVIRRAIAECSEATGLTRTTLHASDAGYSLYAAMGYEAGARFPMLLVEH